MTTFEILSIIVSALLILGAILGIYIKMTISITSIQVQIVEIKRDLMTKEIAIINIEKNNREDFKENREANVKIIEKIDRVIETLLK